jgi:hypothetical protein
MRSGVLVALRGRRTTMGRYEFVLRLNRKISEKEVDALYEAGCGDAAVETSTYGTLMDFTREAPTLAEALVSAVRDIEKVPDLRAVGVECDNMVTLSGIADRAGVTSEAARLWASGQRGPGDFPPPQILTASGERIWDWQQVAVWLRNYREPSAEVWTSGRGSTLCTADRVLAAREALLSEPDDATREELERLLQDA